MTATGNLAWQGSNVDATTIERQLTALWGQYAHDELHTHPVRTSIFNLVVYTNSEQEAERIAGTLNSLASRRPSRAIILTSDRQAAVSSIDGRAVVGCYKRTESGQSLCGEQVLITAHGRAADHLASVVIPLLLPELKTYLWWPGQPPFGHRSFHRLLSVADQLVVDSGQFTSPGDGFANIARLVTGRQGVNDIQWARLRTWREIIAQFFDGMTWRPYVWGIRSIRVQFAQGGDITRATAGALLLLAWAGVHIGWEPETTLDEVAQRDMSLAVLQGERLIPVELQFRDHGNEAAGRLMEVELVSQPKGMEPARFMVKRTDDLGHACSIVQVHDGPGIQRTVPLQFGADEEVLVEELELTGHDVEYEQVVTLASRLAGREVWLPQ